MEIYCGSLRNWFMVDLSWGWASRIFHWSSNLFTWSSSLRGFSPINSIKTNVIERTTSFYCLAFPPGEAHRVCTFLKRRVSVRCTYTMVCAIPKSIFLLCKMKTLNSLTSSLIISVVGYLHETVNTSHLYVMGKNHSYDKIQMTNLPYLVDPLLQAAASILFQEIFAHNLLSKNYILLRLLFEGGF